MLIQECNKLHQQIIKKINTWPPESVNNTLMGNLSNNLSYISNNFSYNLSNISANFSSSSNSIKSTTQLNDQSNKSNQNGKLSTSTSSATISSKISSQSANSTPTNSKLTNGDQQQIIATSTSKSPNKSSNGSETKRSNTPINSPTHSQASVSLNLTNNNNSIIPVNNTKIDEELIDIICKLNQKCEFLNKYGTKHDYTGKQVNGYFSMLRIISSFFGHIIVQMDKKKRKMFPDLIEVGNLLLVVLNAMEEYAQKYAELRARYDSKDFNFDLLTDVEDDDEIKKNTSTKNGVEASNSDVSSNESEDELDEIDNFDNISSNLVKMSSNLANSIESMKSQCENVYDDLANNNETFDPIIGDDGKEKIEDYYRNNELKDIEDDKEYGKEIKKEEYESILQKYYKRFNFNFKLSKSSSCTSPVNDDGSPKKVLSSPLTLNPNSATNGKEQRPESPKKAENKGKVEKKYYKYFSNLKNNFEENLSRLTATGTNSSESSFKTISEETTNGSPKKNGKIPNSSSSNGLKSMDRQLPDGIFLEDSLDQEDQNLETEEEKRLRNAKLDEYILSKFDTTNDDLHLVTPPMLYFFEGFTLTLDREKQLALIYGRVTPWWYCKSACQIASLVRNLVVILTSPPSKSIVSLYNTDTSSRIFAHRQVNATLDSLLQGLATLEVKAYNRRYFKYLYRGHVIYGKTIRLPVHSEFEIPAEGNELIRHKLGENTSKSNENLSNFVQANAKNEQTSSNDKTETTTNASSIEEDDKIILDTGFNSRAVRCRLINYVRNQNEAELCENSHRCLLFHIHGGGFVLSSPDSHELYLRDWAVKLKGIPILSVDYTLRERYPKAPQDVLDVYMFLVDPKNQEKVAELVGFLPDKIVLAGDSAGANLTFSLICLLNEIRKMSPEYANIKMPTSMVCVYGAFDIRAVMSPSKFICSIDMILHHGNIMAMIGTYAGIAQKIRKTIWSRIKYRRSIAWYRVSERELKARFKKLSKAMESWYASPLVYPHLDELKEISLHLISTHFCSLIDDSVVLYKAWRGSSTFDIYDGLPHAFLNFSDRSEEAKIATDKVAERIIQAFTKKKTNEIKK